MSDNEEYDQGGAGASNTYPQQASALRKNGHVLIKGRPCKIVEMSTSKTGKHGHAKIHMVGIDIFTKKKIEDICPSTHNMNVPNIVRKEYQVTDVSKEGYFTLMDDIGNMIEHLKHTEACEEKFSEVMSMMENDDDSLVVTATVVSALGEEYILKVKNSKAQ